VIHPSPGVLSSANDEWECMACRVRNQATSYHCVKCRANRRDDSAADADNIAKVSEMPVCNYYIISLLP